MSETATATVTKPQKGILMTDTALQHLKALRQQQGTDLCLRVGVRGGGCSGMSYTMDFETAENIQPADEVYDYDGFQVICDPKSLLYIYGMQLDYSNALIGGEEEAPKPPSLGAMNWVRLSGSPRIGGWGASSMSPKAVKFKAQNLLKIYDCPNR
jgi:iron-sulfur cluster assembly protein